MEFFRIIEVSSTEDDIRNLLSLENLENLSTLLFATSGPGIHGVAVGGIWGEFTLSRAPIKGGLRFALTECPNALAWTVTTGYAPAREHIVVHLTINRERKKQEFIDEIEEFLDDHCKCLQSVFARETTNEIN